MFEESAELDPFGFHAPFYRAVLALERKNGKIAETYATRALRAEPYRYDALFIKGLALEYQGKYKEAVKAYQDVLRLYPIHPQAEMTLKRARDKVI